ncbi:glycine betaine ABC transporter substrate-binding protein [Paenibacillus sp. WLX2291]|uniref:glycine betaine ABC transporter substrate-binding protein n=1 Tax=Paenibacillus sp. WLX2291 TaxID=3296934 RepID=UPI003983EF9D
MMKYRKRMMFGCIVLMLILLTACNPERQPFPSLPGSSKSSASEPIGEQLNYQITGVEPAAGQMQTTRKAMEQYGLSDWSLLSSSSAAMPAALERAINTQQPIVVTGWTPHWMFNKYDLKYLDDPKNIFGSGEEIHTVTRKNLKQDEPSAYAFLDRFFWTSEEMQEIMVTVQDGADPADAVKQWADAHPDRIKEWTDGIKPVSGKTIKLSYPAWDSEIVSTNLIAYILKEKLGYNVSMMQVEVGPMYVGLANGDTDAIVAAWLPTTHVEYWKQYKAKLDDLGPNMKGVRIGLVVPAYMNIDSIEDLATSSSGS